MRADDVHRSPVQILTDDCCPSARGEPKPAPDPDPNLDPEPKPNPELGRPTLIEGGRIVVRSNSHGTLPGLPFGLALPPPTPAYH